jgi:capsular polysaccharide biosynthesis protein
MELRALWKVVVRRWWLIALPALAALAYAAYGAINAPPGGGYATSLRFTAAAPPGGEAISYEDSEYYPWLSSEYVVNALTDWVRTGSFAQEVSAQLAAEGIEIPAGAIQGSLNADNERSVMVLYLNWGDAEQLASMADAAAVVLRERSAEYFPQLGEGNVEVVALDTPVIGAVPPPLSARLQPLVRAGLGLVAGVALAFLVEYLDPTLRGRREVEALGISVLAEVPRERR